MTSMLMQCPLCNENYSEAKIPRNLECGHSICTPCINQQFLSNVSCPECCEKYPVQKYFYFPVNYPLTRLIRSYNDGKLKLDDKSTKAIFDGIMNDKDRETGNCPRHKSPVISLCATCSSWVCKDCKILDHPELPRGSCKIISITRAIMQIRKEHKKRSDILLNKVKSLKRKLEPEVSRNELCRKYCRINSNSHYLLVAKIKTQLQEIEKHDDFVMKLSMKELDQMNAKVNETASPFELTILCRNIVDCQENFDKNMAQEKQRTMPVHHNILNHFRMDLKMMTTEGDRSMYAVLHKTGGETKWALITPKNKGLLLYSLRDGKPPEDGIIFPFEFVFDLMCREDPKVFLEIGWDGELKGVVYATLFLSTVQGGQALTLFVGDKGPSFKNTRFFKHDENGILHGGDFANNNGTGEVLRDHISYGVQEHVIKRYMPGILEVDIHYRNRLYFHTKQYRHASYSPIGRVTQGITLLKNASKIKPITNAGIWDCGIFLPLGQR